MIIKMSDIAKAKRLHNMTNQEYVVIRPDFTNERVTIIFDAEPECQCQGCKLAREGSPVQWY